MLEKDLKKLICKNVSPFVPAFLPVHDNPKQKQESNGPKGDP